MAVQSVRRQLGAGLHSIRWRLPLSYAAIALLTAIALGGLLLFTLDSYYNRREREYLERWGTMLVPHFEMVYQDNLGAFEIESSVTWAAFLTQARVQLLDADGQIVVDSGPASEQTQVIMSFARVETEPLPENGEAGQSGGAYLSLDREPPPSDEGSAPPVGRYPLNIRRGPFGQFLTDGTEPGEYSNQQAAVPIYNRNHELLGWLRLLEGPAFGSEIVRDVAGSSFAAGALAVLIAVVAGGLISQGISRPVLTLVDATRQMAQGNLAVRVRLTRRNEFGLLGATFNRMAEQIEATVNALRVFVADAAHEINTPLTALHTNLELVTLYELPGEAKSHLQQALHELRRLEKLTRNLLVLARLEAPHTARPRARLDLAQMARETYRQMVSRAEQAGIDFALDAPAGPVWIEGDQEQIVRLLDNLLDNALKFTPREGQVVLGLGLQKDTARLWVQDSGIGIPAPDLPRLFSRFHRGSNAAAYPGSGLGLAITKAIVEDHQGKFALESTPGATRFTVDLPLTPERSA